MSARAVLRYAPFSPQKARLVADLIRGKSVAEAEAILAFCRKRPARAIEKLLRSAVANAEELSAQGKWHEGDELNTEELFIKRIYVDDSIRLKRIRPRARGMAYRILRRRCHITIEVDDRQESEPSKRAPAPQPEEVAS
ncbi:MAG: 50S ribosomal protein L22 [Candidatus Poribacteria bacterium]|nr:MAG: 50S ribosomal protein L22 [Candidatus Poribacteria bacterium]